MDLLRTLWVGLEDFAEQFVQGLHVLGGLAGMAKSSEDGENFEERVKNGLTTVLALLLVGGVSGGVAAYVNSTQALQKASSVEKQIQYLREDVKSLEKEVSELEEML